jgi:hypothetical protein
MGIFGHYRKLSKKGNSEAIDDYLIERIKNR